MFNVRENKNFSTVDLLIGDRQIVYFFTKSSYGSYIFSNPIAILRKNDLICLPNNRKENYIEIWKSTKSIFGYSDDQVFFYEYSDEINTMRETTSKILENFKNSNFVISTFNKVKIIQEEAEKLQIEVLIDDINFLPDKRWLHSTIPGSKYSSNEFGKHFPDDVSVPNGYSCYDKNELISAKAILNTMGISKMLIKNASLSMGKEIFKFETNEEFEEILNIIIFKKPLFNDYQPVYVIEELVDAQTCSDGNTLSPAVHFFGTQRFPGAYNQIIDKFEYQGIYSKEPNELISDQCVRMAESLNRTLELKGPWGLDFIVAKNGKAYVVDINVGRWCGSHYSRIFMDMYAPKKNFYTNLVSFSEKNLNYYQNKLNECKLSFDFETQNGIVFSKIVNVEEFSFLCVGDTLEEVEHLRKEFDKIFSK